MLQTNNHPKKSNQQVGLFLRAANWVSEAMGRPANIIFWFVLVVIWTSIFAFGGPHLAGGTWLPAWFTSQGFNFPLNLITTVAELFIGFLVAAAANRSQQALTELIVHIKQALDNDVALEQQIIDNDNHIDHQLQVIAKHLHIDPKELDLPDKDQFVEKKPDGI